VMSSAAEAELAGLLMQRKLITLKIYWPKWDIHNHLHHCKRIIRRRKEWLITQCSRNGQSQWICDSIGWEIVQWIKNNFEFIGDQVKRTSQIISQNITHRHIIVICEANFLQKLGNFTTWERNAGSSGAAIRKRVVSCKGVLDTESLAMAGTKPRGRPRGTSQQKLSPNPNLNPRRFWLGGD
jgi:hypothetical protein